jgi:hypothetical protein
MKGWKQKMKVQRDGHPFIVRRIIFLNDQLRKFADVLQQKSKDLSPTKLKWMLALFCALFIGLGSCIIFTSLQSNRKNVFTVTPIQALPILLEPLPQPVLTKEELEKLHRFKIYLDSLSQTKKGKALRDSLLYNRRHLLDTLEVLEKLYAQQNKN